ISGVLSGWDRIRFRGTLRRIASLSGMGSFLSEQRILLKEFKDWALSLTGSVRGGVERLAEAHDLRVEHVASSATNKEERARSVAGARWEQVGLSCILSSMELCRTFTVVPNRATKWPDLRLHDNKCLHYYF